MPTEKRWIQERERPLKEAATGSTSLQGWLRKSQQADEEQPQASRHKEDGDQEAHSADDEPGTSAAFREPEPEPIPDEIRTDWQNRERRDEYEDEMRERRTSEREDIEVKSGAESTDLDCLLRLAYPTDPAHVQSSNLKYDQTFITFSLKNLPKNTNNG
ncbi:unnamed protein product [Boreogadus saida]